MTIDSNTQLLGLLGWPVGHSLSPAMHNAAAADLGLNIAYVPLPVAPEQLPVAVRGLAAVGFRGVNVTVPHKQAAMALVDTLTKDAQAIGAINTIVFEQDGRMTGHNTDWVGFLADLAALEVPSNGRDCLVLGAGGSARGVVYGLSRGGGRVHVLARRADQAEALAADLSFEQAMVRPGALADLTQTAAGMHAPLIVNTTPLGMSPNIDASPWPNDQPFLRDSFAYDLVYNPAQTRFLQQAASDGCGTANGLGMLVQQAALAFALWTGQAPDTAKMRAAAEAALVRTDHKETS